MKKLISIILAVTMIAALFSGLVIFDASAEEEPFTDKGYIYTNLPGIQDWGETEMTAYNTQAAVKEDSSSGTPGELVTTHLTGSASQAIKLTTNGSPNAWTISFSTCGNTSDKTKKSQIGNVLGDYSELSTLSKYDGIRIAIQNENGNKPSFITWDKTNSHIACLRLLSSEAGSWSNSAYPFMTNKQYDEFAGSVSDPIYATYYDGYYYFDFDLATSGWGGNFMEKYANKNWKYGNMFFWIQNGGINASNYNGGAVYISDMQLYTKPADPTPENLAALVNTANGLDVFGDNYDTICDADAIANNTASSKEDIENAMLGLSAIIKDFNDKVPQVKQRISDLLDTADELGLFEDTSPYADELFNIDTSYNSSVTSTEKLYQYLREVERAVADNLLEDDIHDAAMNFYNTWKYNYTGDSVAAFAAEIRKLWNNFDTLDEEETTLALNTAYSNLIPAARITSGENWLENWTTDDVNEVVTNNPTKLCDNIGDGRNTNGVYNNGDFTNNTVFTAEDGAFTMVANADFINKSIGYKNMDRSGDCTGMTNAGYPALNFTSIKDYAGIRLKINVEDGSVGRLLIGLSNCKELTREMYALNIKPEYVDKDGYINLPFSIFEAAFWGSAFKTEELDKTIVVIFEAYNVANGTAVTISDIEAYKPVYVPENKVTLLELMNKVISLDTAGRYANAVTTANEVIIDAEASATEISDAESLMTSILNHIDYIETDPGYYYDYTSVPGFSEWTAADCDTHNGYAAQSNVSLATAGVVGGATQSICATEANGSFTVSNCDAGTAAETAPKIADPFNGYHASFKTTTGLRFAVTDKNGLPVFLPDNGTVTLTLYGNAAGLPAYSATLNAADLNNESDYFSFDFADMKSGDLAFADLDSFDGYQLFSLTFSGTNIADLNGGALYFSDVQLFTRHEVLPREDLIWLITENKKLDTDDIFVSDIDDAETVCNNDRATQKEIDDATDWMWEVYTALADDFGNFDPKNVVATVGAAADPKVEHSDETVKLLMIGNSFSWNAYTYIRQIAQAAGVDLVVANLYYSGCSLERHWSYFSNNSAVYSYDNSWGSGSSTYTIEKALADQDWDYISIQQVSGYAGKYDDSYQPYLHNIVSYLRENEPGAEIIWHQTWAYQKTSDHVDFPKYDNDQDKMWTAIEASSKKACEVEGIKYIVPSGKAFQNARATSVGDNLNADGFHANELGCYIAGYCFLSTVSGSLPNTSSYNLPGVDATTMKLIKKAVTDAVEEYGYVAYSDSSAYVKAINTMEKYARGKLDGMLFAGNLVNDSNDDATSFKVLAKDFFGSKNVMFTLGATDYTLSAKAPVLYSTLISELYANDLEAAAQKRVGNRHIKINGINVYGIGYDSVKDGFATYSTSTLSWLDSELAAIDAEKSDMPVIIVTTYPVTHTAGSHGASAICDVLKKHDNIVVFSGGTDASLESDAIVHYDGFTAVNVGTLQGENPEAMLVDIDINGNIRIRCINVNDGKAYEKSYIINADGSNRADYAAGYYEAPTVNVESGKTYNLSQEDAPVMTWLQDGEKATLNGAPCAYGTTVSDPGDYTLVVTAGTKKTTVSFSVTDGKALNSIEISVAPAKLTYTEGDELDLTGAKLKLNYSNSTFEVIDITATMVSGYDSSAIGSQKITVTYGEFSTFFNITVEPAQAPGDLDGDEEISVTDALVVLRFAAKLAVPTQLEKTLADVDKDGEITVTDALAVLRVAAKLATGF